MRVRVRSKERRGSKLEEEKKEKKEKKEEQPLLDAPSAAPVSVSAFGAPAPRDRVCCLFSDTVQCCPNKQEQGTR